MTHESLPTKRMQIQRRRETSQTCRVCGRLIMAGQILLPDAWNKGNYIHFGCLTGPRVPPEDECAEFDKAMDAAAETDV